LARRPGSAQNSPLQRATQVVRHFLVPAPLLSASHAGQAYQHPDCNDHDTATAKAQRCGNSLQEPRGVEVGSQQHLRIVQHAGGPPQAIEANAGGDSHMWVSPMGSIAASTHVFRQHLALRRNRGLWCQQACPCLSSMLIRLHLFCRCAEL
jgi:hypothetical protein